MIVPAAAVPEDDPETVIVIYQVKPNDEADPTQSDCKTLERGATARSQATPPDEITRIWQEMGQLVEARPPTPESISRTFTSSPHSPKLAEHATMSCRA